MGYDMKDNMQILHRSGNYTLIHLPNNRCTPFVWAYYYDSEAREWASGRYFGDIMTAVKNAPEEVKNND